MAEAGDNLGRREFLRRGAAGAAALALPAIIPASALGKDGATAPSERLVCGAIGLGGRGNDDIGGFLGRRDVQVVAVCDVYAEHCERARLRVNGTYHNADCKGYNDFREITRRDDIDIVMIATPDHWHAVIACDAMRYGKDVFCEKPETLTIREGQILIETARHLQRVFSGGSQRVWEDYNLLHKVVRSGDFGAPQEVWVNVGGPSTEPDLPAQPVPEGLDWDRYLGPAPWRPFNNALLNFRNYRDYSGGGMTDWGAHGFGGALFACGLQDTGPVEIIPPNGKDVPRLTYVFANGVRFYHGGGWGGVITMKLEHGEFTESGPKKRDGSVKVRDLAIPNYKGRGGLIGDFLYCVRSRERCWRDIAVAHRTVSVCHLGNLAYWLNRPLKWDPDKQEFIGDAEANRWLDRPKRAPWQL